MKKYMIWLLGGIVICVLIFLPIKYSDVTNNFIAMFKNEYFYRITGNSMYPTFNDKQMWYGYPCEKDSCWNNNLKRGDVVVIDIGNKDFFIKRIIGLPGEVVTIVGGNVYINKNLLNEPYLQDQYSTLSQKYCTRYAIGNDQLFVLGDNRRHSNDSRYLGVIKLSQVMAYSEYSRYQKGVENPSVGTQTINIDEKDCPLFQ